MAEVRAVAARVRQEARSLVVLLLAAVIAAVRLLVAVVTATVVTVGATGRWIWRWTADLVIAAATLARQVPSTLAGVTAVARGGSARARRIPAALVDARDVAAQQGWPEPVTGRALPGRRRVRRLLGALAVVPAVVAVQALPGLATPASAATTTWVSYRHSFTVRVALPGDIDITGTGIKLKQNLHVASVAVAVSYMIPTPNPNGEICAVSTHAVQVYKPRTARVNPLSEDKQVSAVVSAMSWSDGAPKQVVQPGSSIYANPHKGGPGNALDCGSSATLQYGNSSLKLEQSASVALGLSGGFATNLNIYPNWSRSVTLFPPQGHVSTPKIGAGCARLDTGPSVPANTDREVYAEECAKVGRVTKVAFVIDNTGSMGGSIEAAIAAAKSVAAALPEDAELALVTYNDPDSNVVGDFGTDRAAFRGALDTITVGGGGDYPEHVLGGLMKAVQLKWPKDGCRRIVLLGDAPGKDPEPGTGHTMESVLAAAKKGGVDADTAAGVPTDFETGCPETTPTPPADLAGGTDSDPHGDPEVVVGGAGEDTLEEPYDGIVIDPVWIGDVSGEAAGSKGKPKKVDGNATGGPESVEYWEQTFQPLADGAGGLLSSARDADQVGNALLGAVTGHQVLSTNLPTGRVESVTGQKVTGWASQTRYDGPITVRVCRTGRTSCVEAPADRTLEGGTPDKHGFSVDVAFPAEEAEVYALAVDSEGKPNGQEVLLVGQPVKKVEVVAPQPKPEPPAPPAPPPPAPPVVVVHRPPPPPLPPMFYPEKPAEPAKGSLNRVDTEVIAGWARQPGIQRAVEVEIHVDGKPYRTVRAEEPRQELLDQGIGAYGFQIPNDVGPGHTIEAYAIGINANGTPNGTRTRLDGAATTPEPAPVSAPPPAAAPLFGDFVMPVVPPPDAPAPAGPPAPAAPVVPAVPAPVVPVPAGPPAPVVAIPPVPDLGIVGPPAPVAPVVPAVPAPVDPAPAAPPVPVVAIPPVPDLGIVGPPAPVAPVVPAVPAPVDPVPAGPPAPTVDIPPVPDLGLPAPAAPPVPASGPAEGFLDTVDAGSIGGWARQPGAPGPIDVEIHVDGAVHRTVRADQHRQDLVNLGIGAVGFNIPNDIGPGHAVEAYAVGVNPDGTPNGQKTRLQGGGVTPAAPAVPVVSAPDVPIPADAPAPAPVGPPVPDLGLPAPAAPVPPAVSVPSVPELNVPVQVGGAPADPVPPAPVVPPVPDPGLPAPAAPAVQEAPVAPVVPEAPAVPAVPAVPDLGLPAPAAPVVPEVPVPAAPDPVVPEMPAVPALDLPVPAAPVVPAM